MAQTSYDPLAIAIALAVLAMIGAWGWHLVSEVRATSAAIIRLADRRAKSQRDAIDAGAALGRGESVRRRVAQVLCLLLLVAVASVALLNKFGLI